MLEESRVFGNSSVDREREIGEIFVSGKIKPNMSLRRCPKVAAYPLTHAVTPSLAMAALHSDLHKMALAST